MRSVRKFSKDRARADLEESYLTAGFRMISPLQLASQAELEIVLIRFLM